MFDDLKLPRWLGWIAFIGAGLFFVAKIVLSIWLVIDPVSNPRIDPSIGLIDIGLGVLLFFAAVGLKRSGEFNNLFRVLDRRIRGHVTAEHEKTRSLITNTHSANYGFQLLKTSQWEYVPAKEQFYCVDNTDWKIIQKEQHRTFSESWINNIYRADMNVRVFQVVLKHNNTEVREVIFIVLDGSRIIMPIPEKAGAEGYFYCEGSIRHLLFNIVRESMGMYMDGVELQDLARQAKIQWKQCSSEEDE